MPEKLVEIGEEFGLWSPPPGLKLNIEMIPRQNWGLNARKYLSAKAWGIVSRYVIERAGKRCEVCKAKSNLHCHEGWKYYMDYTEEVPRLRAKVVKLSALCAKCHACVHAMRTISVSKDQVRTIDRMVKHFIKVNGSTDRKLWGKAFGAAKFNFEILSSLPDFDIDLSLVIETLKVARSKEPGNVVTF